MKISRPEMRSKLFAFFLFIAVMATFIFLIFHIKLFIDGQRGLLRGSIILFISAFLSLLITLKNSKFKTFIILLLVVVSFIGVFDMLIHNPGSDVYGINPRFPYDFSIFYYGAIESYKLNNSPYGIMDKYDLINTSVSFPFPTYFLHYLVSGFCQFSMNVSALLFSLCSFLSALMLIVFSLKLSNIPLDKNVFHKDKTNLLILLFIIFSSHTWGIIVSGQTGVFASLGVIIGIYYLFFSKNKYQNSFSGLAWGAGIMFKPNLCLTLLACLGAWLNTTNKERKKRIIISFLSTIFMILFSILGTIFVEGGTSLATYKQFLFDVYPLLVVKIKEANNISTTGLLLKMLNYKISHFYIVLTLLCGGILWGVRSKQKWGWWLVLTLAVSPFTWSAYTPIFLPIQLKIFNDNYINEKNHLISSLLILSLGLLYFSKTGIGSAGLILTAVLTSLPSKQS